MNKKNLLTQLQLKSHLHYNPDNGVFTWIKCKSNNIKCGQVAGHIAKNGYVTICVFNVDYLAHRLAWLYIYGIFPKDGIDHKDQNPSNNRILNLRNADQFVNGKNCKKSKRNTSGVVGVGWCREQNKWYASIRVRGKGIRLGRFLDKDDAIKARKRAEKLYGFHKNHGT